MKFGLTVSTIFHTLVIVFGLFSLSTPRVLQVADVDALSIDIVDVSELTKTLEGEADAEERNTPSAASTTRQDHTEDAIHVGDGDKDIDSDGEELGSSRESSQLPSSSESSDVSNLSTLQESQEVNDESDTPVEEFVTLPTDVPVPTPSPNRESITATTPTEREDESDNVDEVAALLNRQRATQSGLKRTIKEAGLGTSTSNNDTTLSRSEIDALRSKIQSCWNVGALAGSENASTLRAKVDFSFNPDGTLVDTPEVTAVGGTINSQQAFAGGAKRAIVRCAPYDLPEGKYDEWSDVTVYFSLKDML